MSRAGVSSTIEVVPTTSLNPTAHRYATHRIAIASLKPGAGRLLRLWHLASFDAPSVALVWAFSFAWAAGTRLPMQAAAVMVLGVWTVYVGDRLLDARAALRSHAQHRLRERHFFHWRHRKVLAPLAAIAGAATAVLVLACIPVVARERDSVLAAASLAYFARVHHSQLSGARRTRPFFPPLVTKELLVGVLFAIGCALPSFGRALAEPLAARLALLTVLLVFATLAWLNCHAIERWESDSPHRRGPTLKSCGLCLATIGLAAAMLLSPAYPRPALLLAAAALSAVLLVLLDRIRASLSPVTLRAAADLVLLVPALLIPITWVAR